MRAAWLRLIVASALLFSAGCASHSMDTLPGRLASRLVVDNGVSVLDGRVLYLNPKRTGQGGPWEVPVAGADVDLLGADGQVLPQFGAVRTDGRGRFHFDGLVVGQAYFARARLTDAAGKPRQLYAFVLPEGNFTCVELSLASTVVAQKIAASPDQIPTIKPGALAELVKTVRKTLADLVADPAPPGGPPAAPPIAAGKGPAVPAPPVDGAPSNPIWVPGPNGDGGYWWAPHAGGPGGCWWIETPCGGVWWAPGASGAAGRWWVNGAWVAAGAGSVLTVPGGSCSFDVTRPPAENCGCVCVPGRNGDRRVYWFLPDGDGSGGSWWIVSNLGGSWQDAALGGAGGWGAQPGGQAGTGSAQVGSPSDTSTWITLPGGQGGYYWSPTGGPGGSWWVPDATTGGGYWWTGSGATPAGAPPGPGGSCGCHYVQPPGSSVGYWFLPDGNGAGGSWWITDINNTSGSWWRAPSGANGGAAPTTAAPVVGGSGGFAEVPGGGTDSIWIVLPGGGGTWWAAPATGDGGAGAWWLPGGGTGGSWWVSTGAGAPGNPPPGPDGSSGCGCHWIQPPGSSSGYWYMPVSRRRGTGFWYVYNVYTGHWSWVSASSPTIAGAGGTWAPSAAPAGSGTGTAAPSPGSRTSVVTWITLPGGGGYWWYPWPNGGGASYWNGSAWVSAPVNAGGYYWITLPGGGGTWVWPSPDGHGCCCWVPDGQGGGSWVWIVYGAGDGTPPAPPTVIVNVYDFSGLIEGLTAPTWTPGTTTGSATFDQLAASVPAMQTQLEQAIDTILNVNIIMPFAGVNNAPFPRKDDPRYLLIGTVQLHCNLEDLPVAGVAYALNGEEICRTSTAGDTWQAEYDTHKMKDGEYFLTAHELGPNGQGLGKMLAKGYARIRNQDATADPCADQWDN